MLRWRLIGAFCLIAPLVALLWLDDQKNFGYPGVWLALVGAIVSSAASVEIVDLFRDRMPSLSRLRVGIAAFMFFAIAAIPVFRETADCPVGMWGWTALGALAALASILIVEIVRYDQSEGVTQRVAMQFFAVAYVAIPFCFFLYLRLQVPGRLGLLAIISVIFVVKWSDAGAYFTGRAIGRNKLAPKISPGKTIEGAIGGTLFAVIAAIVYHWWIVPKLVPDSALPSISVLVIYGVALSVVGILGDLTESMFKRDANKKDSANWLPGLGGVLDILDSLLWAAPAAYLFWAAGLMAG